MSTVLGEDDESTDNEQEEQTLQPNAALFEENASSEGDVKSGGKSEEETTGNNNMPHLTMLKPGSNTDDDDENATKKAMSGLFPDTKLDDGNGYEEKGLEDVNASSFPLSDPARITMSPAVFSLIGKNRKFLSKMPTVVNNKMQGIEDVLKETSKAVQQTLNTLQDIPISLKLGINDATELCDLIEHSVHLVPRMK
eukprot:jgi/Bigna1/89751/estExt_fgenesh1_pg.C_550014